MSNGDRASRLHRLRARQRRRRRVAGAIVAGLLGVGVLAAVVAVGGHGGQKQARPAASPRVAYGGDKLPVPIRPRKRTSWLPSADQQYRAVRRLRKLGYPVLCGGGRKGNYVALTFDDGPGPSTEAVLDVLRERRIRATFFILGRMVKAFPELARREAREGAVGDHTWSHADLTRLSSGEIDSEVRGARDIIRTTTQEPVLLFRPPYGARDERVDRVVRSLGLLQVLWSVDSRDALGAGSDSIGGNVLAGLKPGAIVLMHENQPATIVSLVRYVLPELERRKLRAVTVPELLALDPPSLAQLRARQC